MRQPSIVAGAFALAVVILGMITLDPRLCVVGAAVGMVAIGAHITRVLLR